MQCKESSLLHPTLRISKTKGGSFRGRRFYQIGGMAMPINYTVHHSNIVNLSRALLTRVFFVRRGSSYAPTPRPDVGVYSRLDSFKDRMCAHLPSTTPIPRLEFPSLYEGRRKTIYTQAAESLQLHSVTRKDARIKAFVKAEKICLKDKVDPDPRVIQPRDPRYNVEVGRFLKPIEKNLYQAVAKIFHEPTIFKGFNAAQSGRIMFDKWNCYSRPVAIGLDASRFDQHVSRQALEWEHSIYNHVFRGNPELARLLEWQISNFGVGYCTDGRLEYSVDGCRMSGDMNTALGNCIIMCALVHTYASDRIPKFSLANNGDDCVLIFERRYLDRIHDLGVWFLEMGFTMKVEPPVYEFEQIEFCQTHPVYDGSDYIMVRNFPQSLAKDAISIKPLDSLRYYCGWMKSVGDSGVSLTGGIPVLQSYYRAFQRAGGQSRIIGLDSVHETGLRFFAHGMTREFSPVSPKARHSFYLAFGCTPEEQICMEAYYDSFTPSYNPELLEVPDFLPPWL
jgi:hypothetical protein